MSRAITFRISVILILFTSVKMNAQQWLGRTTGNYSGTYGLYNNASSIADSKYRYYFNFWGRGINFYNNAMFYNAPIKINQWANGTYDLSQQRLDGKPDFQKDWLKENLNGKTKQFSFNQDIWGPAFMFPISHSVNMSINTRQRSSLQIFGVSQPLARFASNGLDSTGGVYSGSNGLNRNTSYSNGKFGVNAQSFQELSFSFAGILAKNAHSQLTGGATVKFIRGLGAAYIKGSGFDFAATGNNTAQLQNADLQYAYTDDKSVVAPFNKPYGLFTLQSKGGGAGVDLGLTYTYRSNRGKYANNKYCNDNAYKSDHDFKLALALNDFGGIRFSQGAIKYTYTNNAPVNLNVPSNVLNGFNHPTQNAFDTIGTKVFGQLGANKTSGFGTSLPTALNLQMDFRMSAHLYTSVYLNQSMKSVNSTGMRSTSMLSVIPRFESRGFEFSMPLTLSENYKNFYVGAYARFGPVFVGSDNLGGLLNVASNTQFRGADIYGGVSFGIGHCHRWWYQEQVEPTRIDTVKQRDTIQQKDSVKTVKRDTVKIIKHDTVKLKIHDTIILNKKGEQIIKVKHDTLYIEKIIKSPSDINKENDLKKKEEILNARQKQLDQREKDIQNKEKGTYNETEVLKNCKTQTAILTDENITLKNKVTTQADEINKLKQQIDALNKNKSLTDAEILALKSCNGVVKYDESGKLYTPCQLYEIELNRRKNLEKLNASKDATIDSLNNNITGLNVQIDGLKKILATKNQTEVVKGTDAEKLQKAQKQLDSLNIKIVGLQAEIINCKKNASTTDVEIVKTKTAKAKADAEVLAANRKADSLQTKLTGINIELTNCKKGNTSSTDAEIVKAKSDKAKAETIAAMAGKKADSLQVIINGMYVELTNCKKGNSSSTDAEIVKAKSDKAKAETIAAMAGKKADSLQVIITGLYADLDNCKKGSSSTDATLAKLKKCQDDAALIKEELNFANKLNLGLNAKVYKRDATIDSLINELSKCGNNNGVDNADLLKKCNDAKATLNAEIVSLKAKVNNTSNSLDSANSVTANIRKDKSSLEAQIVTLNAQIKNNSNCDDLKKQLDEKNATINDLNSQNSVLQNKVTALTNQLNELKTEYNFVNAANQKCSKKLDSCMRGLFNNPPNNGSGGSGGSGNGGPSEGSINNNDSNTHVFNSVDSSKNSNIENGNNEEYPSTETKEKPLVLLKLAAGLAKILINAAATSSSTPPPTTQPNTNTGGTSKGTTTTTTTTTTPTNNRRSETPVPNRNESGNTNSTRRR